MFHMAYVQAPINQSHDGQKSISGDSHGRLQVGKKRRINCVRGWVTSKKHELMSGI